MTDYSPEWHDRSLRFTRRWRTEKLPTGGRYSLAAGVPRMNVGLYVVLAPQGACVRYVGKVRRPGRFNSLAMRMEEHHGAGEMDGWGDDVWTIPLAEDLTDADVLDAEAVLIDVLNPTQNKTHRPSTGLGGWENRGIGLRAPRPRRL